MSTPSQSPSGHPEAPLHAFDTRLLERIERRSKWAGVAVLAGAAIVAASFGISIVKLRSLRQQTTDAQTKLDQTSEQLAAKQQQITASSRQLAELNSQLKFRQSVYAQLLAKNQIPAAALSTAADTALQTDPSLATQITASVSIQFSRQDQRPTAQAIQSKLEALKYQVPEIIYVGEGAPNESQIRYFFKSDAGSDLSQIQQVLQQAGVSAQPQFIGLQDAPPTLRPKVFEVWLGLDYTPPAPAR